MGESSPDIWLDGADRNYPATVRGNVRTGAALGIIIHATGGLRAVDAFSQLSTKKISWHVTIDRDGKVYQHVPLNRTANHAGDAELTIDGRKTRNLNHETIGIELVNLGALVKVPDGAGRTKWEVFQPPDEAKGLKARLKSYRQPIRPAVPPTPSGTVRVDGIDYPAFWEVFPPAQIDTLNRVLRAIERAVPGSTKQIFGHRDVAVPRGDFFGNGARKIDPSPTFPWESIDFGSLSELQPHPADSDLDNRIKRGVSRLAHAVETQKRKFAEATPPKIPTAIDMFDMFRELQRVQQATLETHSASPPPDNLTPPLYGAVGNPTKPPFPDVFPGQPPIQFPEIPAMAQRLNDLAARASEDLAMTGLSSASVAATNFSLLPTTVTPEPSPAITGTLGQVGPATTDTSSVHGFVTHGDVTVTYSDTGGGGATAHSDNAAGAANADHNAAHGGRPLESQ